MVALNEQSPVQRFNLTCPLCEERHEDGVKLDQHLARDHGLGRDERFSLYQKQVADRAGLSEPGDASAAVPMAPGSESPSAPKQEAG